MVLFPEIGTVYPAIFYIMSIALYDSVAKWPFPQKERLGTLRLIVKVMTGTFLEALSFRLSSHANLTRVRTIRTQRSSWASYLGLLAAGVRAIAGQQRAFNLSARPPVQRSTTNVHCYVLCSYMANA